MTLYSLKRILFSVVVLSFLATSCKDDDGPSMEEATFKVSIENIGQAKSFLESGVFSTPMGDTEAGPLLPGDAYEFTVHAGPHILPMDGGARLSFVTMMVQSNDLFYAPDESGIELFSAAGIPVGSESPKDVTDQIYLWDAGTEVNEMTGGPNQKPQQDPMAEDVGTDENGVVTKITNNTDGINTLPDVSDVIKVTISNTNGTDFLVRIENVSDGSTIMTTSGPAAVPLSPGVWVVHNSDNPLFTAGNPASEGIENIAEDGFPEVAAGDVTQNTGLTVPLSPGVYAVHESGNPLFTIGQPDYGEGLEAIAEDGVPTDLATFLSTDDDVTQSGFFNTAVGGNTAGAIAPGEKYEFTFTANSDDRLSLVTMFVQSNDWFYAFPPDGIALFDGDDPVTGEVTSSLRLYDAGTEADEFPGAGPNQVIRQGNADTGADDTDNTVRVVSNPPAIVPDLDEIIRVTISTQ